MNNKRVQGLREWFAHAGFHRRVKRLGRGGDWFWGHFDGAGFTPRGVEGVSFARLQGGWEFCKPTGEVFTDVTLVEAFDADMNPVEADESELLEALEGPVARRVKRWVERSRFA